MYIKKVLFAVATIFLSSTTIFAATKKYRTETINNVALGDINIGLEEYTLDENGREIPMPDKSIVIPGDNLPEIVRIHNIARDAWVRIKLDLIAEKEMKGLDHSLVTLASDEWLKIGDYYYSSKPLKHGTYVDFMKSIHIPEYWTEAYAEREFKVVVSADAVQYKNFTPDFQSTDPWFGTLIEQCVHDEYELPATEGNQNFSVEFRGGSEGFIKIGDDFFENWSELMPGDTEKDTIDIKNTYSRDIKLYFKTENLEGEELLKELDIKITGTDGSVIYDGKMDKPLTQGVLLAEYKSGTAGKLNYTIHVPEELTNKYATSKAKVKWIFETELGEENPNNGSKKDNPTYMPTVQTGDFRNILLYLVIVADAAVIMFLVMKGGKRCEEE